MKIKPNDACYCYSGKKYKKCCKPYHEGILPKTAELLMRSRYSAFRACNASYIMKTTHKENADYTELKDEWRSSILEFCVNTQFLGLEILEFIDGDDEAYVTFRATLKQHGEDISFTEKSKFYKCDNAWLYHSGEF